MTHYTNIKCEYQEVKKTRSRKHLNLIASLSQFVSSFQICTALTQSQVDRLVEANEEKKGVTIRMSKTQLAHNMKIGGFLPALAGLIQFLTGTVLPCLEVRALSLASTGVQKLIGNGLYLKKGSGVCRIETDGEGQYLGPASGKEFETVGNSLYLMKQGGLHDDRGPILRS